MVVELRKSHLSTTEARPKSTLWVTPLLVWTSQRCYSAWAAERCPGLPYNLSNRNVNTPLLNLFSLGLIKENLHKILVRNFEFFKVQYRFRSVLSRDSAVMALTGTFPKDTALPIFHLLLNYLTNNAGTFNLIQEISIVNWRTERNTRAVGDVTMPEHRSRTSIERRRYQVCQRMRFFFIFE